jgi:undecaprenyl-diphosphatase
MSQAVPNSAWRELSLYCTEHVTSREAVLIQRFASLRTHPWLAAVFLAASRLGDGPLWYATGATFLAFGEPRTRWAVLAGAITAGLAVATFMAVKHKVCRPRPYEIWVDLPCLAAAPDKFSFPSGHTMTAFSLFAVFRLLVPGSEWFFLPAAGLIGTSRVFLGLHYPSDVLAGALLGTGIGSGVGWAATLLLP